MHVQTGQFPTAVPVRGARVGDFPAVTVLVTSAGETRRLEECLASVIPQCESIGAQLLVVRAADDADVEQLRTAYPNVGFVRAERGASVREMRALGLADADGDIIVLEEDRPVPEGWLVPRMSAGPRGGAGIE